MINVAAFLLDIVASSFLPKACRTKCVYWNIKIRRLWHWMLLLPYVVLIRLISARVLCLLLRGSVAVFWLPAFLPSQWSTMQSCRKKKNQQTKLVRLFSCACVCICVCAYGLVDAVSMSPFSIGVYGNSLLLLLLFLFTLPLIGRDVFMKCISQQRVHSFGVIY